LSTGDLGQVSSEDHEVVDPADNVAFEAADDVAFAESFGGASGEVVDGRFVESHADDHCPVKGSVDLPVPAVVDAMLPAGDPGSGGDGADPGEFRERCFGVDAFGVVTGDNQDLRGGVDTDAEGFEQLRCV
jgi:hypothetical protein